MAVLKDLIVHGSSRFLNGASFNTINAESIGANQGIFNKLIATTLDAKEATIDNLTAQNATVVGLLDVQGELHTNSWTNTNIANIGGSFYISPTVEPTDGTTTISITRNSATSWTVSAAGTFATDFVKSGTATSGVTWPANSLVLITGDVVVGDMVYPLGTLKGTLSAQVTATAASTSKTITITGVTDAQNNTSPSVLQTLYELNNNANISNAAFKNGKISLYKLGSNPIGILLSSMGTSSNSIIDIYGGVSTNPNVRIGHLAGLPNVNGSAPTGWGIYTDNGYFSGVIVSTSGKIANFTINGSKMYSNGKTSYSAAATNGGIYIGDDYISFGDGTKTYFYKDGTGKIGPWTLSTTYIRNGNVAGANNTSVAGVYLGTDGLNISGGSAANTAYIYKNGSTVSVNIGNKLTWNGSVLKVDGEITTSKLTISSGATVGGDGASQILNSEIEIGGRNFYGYNSDCSTLDGKNVSGTWNITTEDSLVCAHTSGALTSTRYLQSKLPFTPTPLECWTFSAEVKIKNIVRGTTNPMCEFYFGGATLDGSWRGWNVTSWILDGTETVGTVAYTGIGFDKQITDTKWHKVSVSAYFNYNGTSTISAMLANVYLRDCTGDLYIRNIKFERGNKATDWTPAPEDIDVNKYVTEINSDGIWVTPQNKKPSSSSGATGTKIDGEGVGIYSTGVNVAQYGSSTRVGAETSGHVNIASTGMDIYGSNGTVTLAHFGYEPTNGAPTDQGTSVSNDPYYTVGRRYDFTFTPDYSTTKAYSIGDIVKYGNDHYVCIKDMDSAESWTRSHWLELFSTKIGSHSVTEGYDNVATAHSDHAEGRRTVAQGAYSHAEGFYTIAGSESASTALGAHSEGLHTMALSSATHAEGMNTIASGFGSHAEGEETEATGIHAHAQNNGTIARYSQTAIGEYNVAQGTNYGRSSEDFAFIIGNGVSDNARSNALTVNWNGDVNARAFYDGTVSNNSLILALGTYISAGLLTNAGRELVFSIPTGRVFPNGTTVYSISFDIVVRIASTDPSASSGSGAYYIVKKTSGGTDITSFNSTINSSFYDGNNTLRTLASGNWSKTLQGGTNILIDLYNSTSNFFTGNATVLNRVNNMPCAVYLLNISAVLDLPTT